MKKIVIASDSFKGSLTSIQVASTAASVIRDIWPECEIVEVPMADGGEGLLDALISAYGKDSVRCVGCTTMDSLMRPVAASWIVVPDHDVAVIESASSIGLTLLSEQERNPMKTTSFGLGLMIRDAISLGCRKIMVGLGGSATNDAGIGMLAALGFRFYADMPDGTCREIKDFTGESLCLITGMDDSEAIPELARTSFTVACDVDNPLCGPNGAAYVYAPQKGADDVMVAALDKGLSDFSRVLERYRTGFDPDLPGSGAAGGLGAAFVNCLGASTARGADFVLDVTGFDDMIHDADLVITGEGRIDSQTLTGKMPYAVLQRADKQGVPVVALCGSCSGCMAGFDKVLPITPDGMDMAEAMCLETASSNLKKALEDYFRHYN